MHGCHACSLPAADLVAWLTFRRYGFFSSSVALFYGIFGVVELKRGIYTRPASCVCQVVDTVSSSALGAARGAARRAPPHAARHSLRMAVDYFLLSRLLPLSTWRARGSRGFSGGSRDACGCSCARVF